MAGSFQRKEEEGERAEKGGREKEDGVSKNFQFSAFQRRRRRRLRRFVCARGSGDRRERVVKQERAHGDGG